MPTNLLTMTEVAQQTGIPMSHVRAIAANGGLNPVRGQHVPNGRGTGSGVQWLYDQATIKRFAENYHTNRQSFDFSDKATKPHKRKSSNDDGFAARRKRLDALADARRLSEAVAEVWA